MIWEPMKVEMAVPQITISTKLIVILARREISLRRLIIYERVREVWAAGRPPVFANPNELATVELPLAAAKPAPRARNS